MQTMYKGAPNAQKESAPGLVYFHIPLPEYSSFDSSNFTGVRQEGISSASINSGFFATMVEAGDVKAVFTGKHLQFDTYLEFSIIKYNSFNSIFWGGHGGSPKADSLPVFVN